MATPRESQESDGGGVTEAGGILEVRNWSRFQHYRDRCPPWIKLATDTFQNLDFARLQSASKLLAICIWTLASRSKEGTVPDDLNYIRHWGFLGSDVTEKNLNELINKGFIVRRSKVLADCLQDDSKPLERDRGETETEGERETKGNGASLPEWLPVDSWKAFCEMRVKIRKPMTEKAKAMMLKKLGELRDANDLSKILDQSTMNCWQGVFPLTEGKGKNAKSSFAQLFGTNETAGS